MLIKYTQNGHLTRTKHNNNVLSYNMTANKIQKSCNYDTVKFTGYTPIETRIKNTINPIINACTTDKKIFEKLNNSGIILNQNQKELLSYLMKHCNSQYTIFLTLQEIERNWGNKAAQNINSLVKLGIIDQENKSYGYKHTFSKNFISKILDSTVIKDSIVQKNYKNLVENPIEYDDKTIKMFEKLNHNLKQHAISEQFEKSLNKIDKQVIAHLLKMNNIKNKDIAVKDIEKKSGIHPSKIIASLWKLTETGFIEMQKIGHSYRIKVNDSFINNKSIRSGFLIFESNLITEGSIADKLIKKNSDKINLINNNGNIIIRFDKDNPGSVASIAENINGRAILISSVKSRENRINLTGIKILYMDLVDDLQYAGINAQMVKSKNLDSLSQIVLEVLLKEKKPVSRKDIFELIKANPKHLTDCLQELVKKGILTENTTLYSAKIKKYELTPEFRNELEKNKFSDSEIEELKKILTLE